MSKLFAFLKSKTFFANLAISVIFGLILIFATNFWLRSTTNHGEAIAVPDIAGVTLEEAERILDEYKLLFKVIDSADFNPKLPLGGVVAQFPLAGEEVKEGRVVLLTINPYVITKIEVPNVIEKTLRRAVYDLESKGFTVGELIYKADIAKDVVLALEVESEEIQPGDKFIKGTVINLIVGSGLGNERVAVPYFKFLTYKEALLKLKSNSLNLGLSLFDDDVTDTATAVVYKQSPSASHEPKVRLGSFIDLWLTNDNTKITNDSLEFKYHNLDVDSIQAYFEADTTR
jgi:beta-lactam-binding protein with PASTA domain